MSEVAVWSHNTFGSADFGIFALTRLWSWCRYITCSWVSSVGGYLTAGEAR